MWKNAQCKNLLTQKNLAIMTSKLKIPLFPVAYITL